jgi:hypothetical protein
VGLIANASAVGLMPDQLINCRHSLPSGIDLAVNHRLWRADGRPSASTSEDDVRKPGNPIFEQPDFSEV